MSQDSSATVYLMGHQYRFACPPEARDSLLEAARSLDARMSKIRDKDKRLSLEAVAIMAALNLSHDLLCQQRHSAEADAMISTQVRDLLQKVNAVL